MRKFSIPLNVIFPKELTNASIFIPKFIEVCKKVGFPITNNIDTSRFFNGANQLNITLKYPNNYILSYCAGNTCIDCRNKSHCHATGTPVSISEFIMGADLSILEEIELIGGEG